MKLYQFSYKIQKGSIIQRYGARNNWRVLDQDTIIIPGPTKGCVVQSILNIIKVDSIFEYC